MSRILVFGDSIAYGKVDTEGGWVARLRKYFDFQAAKHLDRDLPNVYNQGVSGDTAEDILKRLEAETAARVEEETIFVLAVGTNDSVVDNGQPRYSEQQFRDNYQSIISKMKAHSNKILLVGILPVNESQTTPIPWRPHRHYLNRQILLFDSIISDTAKNNNLPYVSLFELFKDKLALFPDGLHPNNQGHQLICEQIQAKLQPLL